MRFIVYAFAVIGAIVVLISLAGWTSLIFATPHIAAKTALLKMNLEDPLSEDETSGNPIENLISDSETGPSLRDAIRAIDRARHDNRIKGIVLKIGAAMPMAQIEELRDAIAQFRAAGKFAYAYSTSFGELEPGNREYFLAASCDQIWLQPVGTLGLSVPMAESPFAKDFLNHLGVNAEFAKRKEYKTAMDTFTENGFTKSNQEMMASLLGSMEDQLVAGISRDRKLTPATVHQLLENGPYTADDALKNKLIDRIGYDDEMLKAAKARTGDAKVKLIDWQDYLDVPLSRQIKKSLPPPAPDSKGVAIIYGTGEIEEGPSRTGRTGDTSMGADTIVSAFDDAIKDKNIKIIIFRIDSPGGSPIASETIRRAVLRAKAAQKPVIVSMGYMAGSGGYWIATDADRIIADPSTLTGSIGVLAGKFALLAALEKWDIHWGHVSTGEPQGAGNFWSTIEPFDPIARMKLEGLTDSMYQDFISRVAAGRKLPRDKVEAIAKGRVWTGEQAIKIGLVDELGGLDTAFAEARKMLKLPPETPLPFVVLPAPPSAAERIAKLAHMVLGAQMGILPALVEQSGFGVWLRPLLALLFSPPAAEAARMPPLSGF